MEKKIGEPFEFNGKTIVAVADIIPDIGCRSCILLNERCNSDDCKCIGGMRKDNTPVHFELVNKQEKVNKQENQ